MKDSILDNPIWNAMISGNSNLALGNEYAKFFPEDIGPFAGLKKFDDQSFKQLHNILPGNRVAVIFSATHLEIPAYWKIKDTIKALQMIANTPGKSLPNNNAEIVMLNNKHVTQMIALTKLTNPGPFEKRTIEFGDYFGIFSNDNLIAMVGKRLNPGRYVEISAVCTHPDYAGKGYSKALISGLVHKIDSEDNIPILHVRADNEHAINLYKHIGFTVRQEININVIQKEA